MDILNKIDEAVSKEKDSAKVRNFLKDLDGTIDDFMDMLESKAMEIEENPMFQQQVLQLLADTTKEHGEFLMSLKRVAQALDSKSQKLGMIKPEGKLVDPYGKPSTGDPRYDYGTKTGPAPDAAQPSDAGGDMGAAVEELRGLNEAVDIVKRGKTIAQLLVSFRGNLDEAVSNLQGRELVVAASALEPLKKAEKQYLVSLSKILKELGR